MRAKRPARWGGGQSEASESSFNLWQGLAACQCEQSNPRGGGGRVEPQNQVYLKGVKYSKFGHRLPNWPSLGLSFIRNLNETTNPLTKKSFDRLDATKRSAWRV